MQAADDATALEAALAAECARLGEWVLALAARGTENKHKATPPPPRPRASKETVAGGSQTFSTSLNKKPTNMRTQPHTNHVTQSSF